MFRKSISVILIGAFVSSLLTPVSKAQAQGLLGLPEPGAMAGLSHPYTPAMLRGVTVHKDNPFLFDFILDQGDEHLQGGALKQEGQKLVKYFLANLAIPEKDLWVNLSPYEKGRIIPQALSQTEMGRDMLAEDYLLKQITASLVYPKSGLGKEFWNKVYEQAQQMYGPNVQVPVNAFNKVWIMADKASVFEHNQTAFVVDCHLKVMLEEDYLAVQKNSHAPLRNGNAQIVRELILPALEHEVNTGKNFANLRQIFNSIILSSWYKNNLKTALLNQVYADKEKVKGINLNDPGVKDQIYDRYLQSYKKGVFDMIRQDDVNGRMVARKYFSGGIDPAMAARPKVLKAMQSSIEISLGNWMQHGAQRLTIVLHRVKSLGKAIKGRGKRAFLQLPAPGKLAVLKRLGLTFRANGSKGLAVENFTRPQNTQEILNLLSLKGEDYDEVVRTLRLKFTDYLTHNTASFLLQYSLLRRIYANINVHGNGKQLILSGFFTEMQGFLQRIVGGLPFRVVVEQHKHVYLERTTTSAHWFDIERAVNLQLARLQPWVDALSAETKKESEFQSLQLNGEGRFSFVIGDRWVDHSAQGLKNAAENLIYLINETPTFNVTSQFVAPEMKDLIEVLIYRGLASIVPNSPFVRVAPVEAASGFLRQFIARIDAAMVVRPLEPGAFQALKTMEARIAYLSPYVVFEKSTTTGRPMVTQLVRPELTQEILKFLYPKGRLAASLRFFLGSNIRSFLVQYFILRTIKNNWNKAYLANWTNETRFQSKAGTLALPPADEVVSFLNGLLPGTPHAFRVQINDGEDLIVLGPAVKQEVLPIIEAKFEQVSGLMERLSPLTLQRYGLEDAAMFVESWRKTSEVLYKEAFAGQPLDAQVEALDVLRNVVVFQENKETIARWYASPKTQPIISKVIQVLLPQGQPIQVAVKKNEYVFSIPANHQTLKSRNARQGYMNAFAKGIKESLVPFLQVATKEGILQHYAGLPAAQSWGEPLEALWREYTNESRGAEIKLTLPSFEGSDAFIAALQEVVRYYAQADGVTASVEVQPDNVLLFHGFSKSPALLFALLNNFRKAVEDPAMLGYERVGLFLMRNTSFFPQPSDRMSIDGTKSVIVVQGARKVFPISDVRALIQKVLQTNPVTRREDHRRIIFFEAPGTNADFFESLRRILPAVIDLRRHGSRQSYWSVDLDYASVFSDWLGQLEQNLEAGRLQVPRLESIEDRAMLGSIKSAIARLLPDEADKFLKKNKGLTYLNFLTDGDAPQVLKEVFSEIVHQLAAVEGMAIPVQWPPMTKEQYLYAKAVHLVADAWRLRKKGKAFRIILRRKGDLYSRSSPVFDDRGLLPGQFQERIESLAPEADNEFAVVADKASIAQSPGGIDLKTSQAQWNIRKEGQGVQMNLDPAMLQRIKREGIDGLVPEILKMTPVTSIWPLLGMPAPKG